MKRYEPFLSTCDYTGDVDADMRQHPFGDWVRYEGHQQTVLDLQKAQAEIKELKKRLGEE